MVELTACIVCTNLSTREEHGDRHQAEGFTDASGIPLASRTEKSGAQLSAPAAQQSSEPADGPRRERERAHPPEDLNAAGPGAHETGPRVGEREVSSQVRLLDGVGRMDDFRRAGRAGR